jgi:hypothetical protein
MITRRNLLTGMAAFIAAPAIIRVADLMPVKAFADEHSYTFYGVEFGRFEGVRIIVLQTSYHEDELWAALDVYPGARTNLTRLRSPSPVALAS